MSTPAVLILAQNGRYLSQFARAAGYRVWVTDAYGDQDTLANADRWQQLPPLNDYKGITHTLLSLSQNQPCLLIYGTGIENFYPVLDKLPAHITIVGNHPKTLAFFLIPQRFFALLKRLSLAYPETQLNIPTGDRLPWLQKPTTGFGGMAIKSLSCRARSTDYYFQRYQRGISASVLFIANGRKSYLLSCQRQFTRDPLRRDFTLLGLSSANALCQRHRNILEKIIDALVAETKLIGVNSLDFIITQENRILILEINPRFSASSQFFLNTPELFSQHLSACQKLSLPVRQIEPEKKHWHIIYAPYDVSIPSVIDWPSYCLDRPKLNTNIKKRHPLCSVLIDAKRDFFPSQQKVSKQILHLLK